MPQKYNSDKPDLGDWTDWVANGITAVVLGGIVGALSSWPFGRTGIFWGCVAGILLFAIIGFWKQIRHFVRFPFSK